MHNYASNKPKCLTSLAIDSNVMDNIKGTKHQKDAHKSLNNADQDNPKEGKEVVMIKKSKKQSGLSQRKKTTIYNQVLVAKSEC